VPDDTTCVGGAAITGLTGATRIIGAFIPIVATATAQCAGGGSASTMGSQTGSPDEVPGSTSCVAGQVAVGIEGNEGDFVDHIFLHCRNADGSGAITMSEPFFGGPFGTPDVPYDCPTGEVLTGLRGQSVFGGTTIRYVELVARRSHPQGRRRPSAIAPARRRTRTSSSRSPSTPFPRIEHTATPSSGQTARAQDRRFRRRSGMTQVSRMTSGRETKMKKVLILGLATLAILLLGAPGSSWAFHTARDWQLQVRARRRRRSPRGGFRHPGSDLAAGNRL
jgi:hypothetical protein